MPGRIPQSFVNSLVERVDVVAVIGAHVQLKKAGANHVGLCPFHDEKTPSFHVYPDGFHCFGCGAHGTAIGFLMDVEGLTFPEAVESLASSLGLDVPREGGRGPERADPAIDEALSAADEYFRACLKTHQDREAAVGYLQGRGLDGRTARDFGIGLAPQGWDGLKQELRSFGENRLVEAGLLVKSESGHSYDRFRGRIVFPIRNIQGRVIGFGGRAISDADQPKYLNSPETARFHKGRELYGLYEARRAQRRLDTVLVVEGYMDVIALAQHGVTNAVATLGTAIGETHFNNLFRHHIGHVVCCFDGDDAGRDAAWKAVDAAFPTLATGRHLSFVFLPEGEDPDSVIRQKGASYFRGLIASAVPVVEYFYQQLQHGLDLGKLDDRATLREVALDKMANLPAGELRALLLQQLERLTGHATHDLESRLAQLSGRRTTRRTQPPSTSTADKLVPRLLHILVRNPALLTAVPAAERSRLAATSEGTLAAVLTFLNTSPEADTATLLGRFAGEPAYEELSIFAAKPNLLPPTHLENEVKYCVTELLDQHQKLYEEALHTDEPEAWRRHSTAKRAKGEGRVDDRKSAPM